MAALLRWAASLAQRNPFPDPDDVYSPATVPMYAEMIDKIERMKKMSSVASCKDAAATVGEAEETAKHHNMALHSSMRLPMKALIRNDPVYRLHNYAATVLPAAALFFGIGILNEAKRNKRRSEMS